MRIGISWPLGKGKRMWISGGPLAWLVGYVVISVFSVLWLAAWLVVALVQLVMLTVRGIVRLARRGE